MTETKTVSFLKDKKVIVKGIYKEGKWAGLLVNDIKDTNMYPNTKRSYTVPFSSRNGGLIQIFDNETRYKVSEFKEELTEQEYFEKKLRLSADAMNPNANDCFWKTDNRAKVMIPKSGITLDLSNPLDYVKYAILKSNTDKIAPSWDVRLKLPTYQFAIVDEDIEVNSKHDEMELEFKIFSELSRITSTRESMIDFLKVIGQAVPKVIKEEKIKTDIYTFAKQKPKDFLRFVKDPNFDEKVFIADAIKAGAIVKPSRNEYQLPGGLTIANSESELISWLLNSENSKAKMNIKHQIDNSK